VQYFVTARDADCGEAAVETLETAGYEVLDEYDPTAVTVVLGGDGSILYAARTLRAPTILPVRCGASKGHQTSLDESELLAAVDTIEDGEAGRAYRVQEYALLAAESEDVDLPADFTALNDVCLHHQEPTMAAEFGVTLHTAAGPRRFPELIGDGLVVATPFGSSAYFRSITGDTFGSGLGVAFNNVHYPEDAPTFVRLAPTGRVDLRILEADNAAGAVLTRDNDPETVPLPDGASVTVKQADRTVSILRLDA
jgi:hypothetical protein